MDASMYYAAKSKEFIILRQQYHLGHSVTAYYLNHHAIKLLLPHLALSAAS
jgi:hypothetical protein